MDDLHKEIDKTHDSVTLKVFPAIKDKLTPNQVTSSLHPDATRNIVSFLFFFSFVFSFCGGSSGVFFSLFDF